MTNFKEYFRSHMKGNLRPIICISSAVLLMTLLLGVYEHPFGYWTSAGNYRSGYESSLGIPVTFLCILAYVLPVLEFSFFKKRINLDCAYALPISRRAMGAVHYLSGLAILFGTFTLSYLLNFLLMLSYGPGWYHFLPMIPHYFLCLLLGFALYSFLVFVFCEANTKGDGIWFMLLYTFLVPLSYATLVTSHILPSTDPGFPVMPWGVLSRLTHTYRDLVDIARINLKPTSAGFPFWLTPEYVGGFVFWLGIGILAAIGLFFTFGKRRMEKTEEISDSFFGYRTLIPLYAVFGMLYMKDILFWVIIELFALLGYTIYRRGFRYRKSDIVILVSLLVLLFV